MSCESVPIGAEKAGGMGGAAVIRVRGAAISLPCLAIVTIAIFLSPDPRGHGTHEQLGLPACGFLARTGWPCPSCGMTTSVCNMAHGHLATAFQAQPFGVIFFAAMLLFGATGLAELISGRDFIQRLRPAVWWIWLFVGTLLAGWGYELARHMAGVT